MLLTLLIRLNIDFILFLTNSPVFLYLPAHWVSFQMAALFSAVAVAEAPLMMMTGSLKQAKYNALPRGLISCANLQLIRLWPLSVYLFLSPCLLFSSSFLWSEALYVPFFLCSGSVILSFCPWAIDEHLTGLSEPQAPSSNCLSVWERESYFSLLSFSAVYINKCTYSMCTHIAHTSACVFHRIDYYYCRYNELFLFV